MLLLDCSWAGPGRPEQQQQQLNGPGSSHKVRAVLERIEATDDDAAAEYSAWQHALLPSVDGTLFATLNFFEAHEILF